MQLANLPQCDLGILEFHPRTLAISDDGLQLLQESLGPKASEPQGSDKPRFFIAIGLEYLSNPQTAFLVKI